MKAGDDGLPCVKRSASCLGVRLDKDVVTDVNGEVTSESGGMSVRPSLKSFPIDFVPERLRGLVPGARGSNNSWVWSFGAGAFESGPINDSLNLRKDKPDHGCIVSAIQTCFTNYETSLIGTRGEWLIDESL